MSWVISKFKGHSGGHKSPGGRLRESDLEALPPRKTRTPLQALGSPPLHWATYPATGDSARTPTIAAPENRSLALPSSSYDPLQDQRLLWRCLTEGA